MLSIIDVCLPIPPMSNPRPIPLLGALQHVERLECKSVILQTGVQDPDYTAEYHAFHGRLFSDVPRCCMRLHFFTRGWKKEKDVLAAIDEATSEDYLGFITLRPIPSSPVGATILRPPQENTHFLLSKDNFEVHLTGKTFSVNGTPFMQQDNAVGACAQASIWMALRTLRRREGLAAHDPAQITSAATRFLVRGRTLPNREGLQIDQMMEAVRSAGYSPNLLRFRDPNDAPSQDVMYDIRCKLYPYIESEVPVIVAIASEKVGGHAVVLIGHGWDVAPPILLTLSEGEITTAASWASPFFVHNDNAGPYLPLPDQGADEEYSLDKVCYAIPLLPANVYLSAEEAEEASIKLFKEIKPEGQNFVIRTFLQERYKFREYVCTSSMNNEVKTYYRLKELPRRIWVTEINELDDYGNKAITKSTKRVGEIIIDPTGEPDQTPFLSAHIKGFILDKNHRSKQIEAIPIKGDRAYSPLFR